MTRQITPEEDRRLDMFDKTEKIEWKRLHIPILPLNYTRKFYEMINKKKVELISKYLKSQKF
ncbi:MAG: hypothetical protein ABII01_04120 [Candidatus Woesearchaeota archaeon]